MACTLTFATTAARDAGCIGTWLSYHAYARNLLLGTGSDPWTGASAFVQYFAQANRLLRPEVAVIDVGDLYRSWIGSNAEALATLAGKRRPMAATKAMLEFPEPKALLREIVTAAAFQLNQTIPLVLSLPSPRQWFWWANTLASGSDLEISSDDAENASVYVADYIRAFADLDLSGLLFEENPEHRLEGDRPFDAYRPVFNVAKHYRWPLAIRLPDSYAAFTVEPEDVALIIGATPVEGVGTVWGQDVSSSLWQDDALPVGAAYPRFVAIPANEIPETVLDRLARHVWA